MRTLAQSAGDPVAPVVSGGCAYGAWIGRPAAPGPRASTDAAVAVSSCGAQAVPTALTGAGREPASGPDSYQFRQRGSAVALNDAASGQSWVPARVGGDTSGDGAFRLVDNWADVAPPDPTTNDAATENEARTTDDLPKLPPDCTGVPIGVPGAADDTYGVRSGRATVLRVLDNDPSVDCTSVVIDSVSALPASAGEVAIVAGGTAIQVTPAAGVGGALPPIEYQVDNGRGATATARVKVSVVAADRSSVPHRVRQSAAAVEVNGTVSYNVLDDYMSPTGDDLYLAAASTDGGDAVSFRPDGTITFRSAGDGAGTDRRVEFVVTDGTQQATGTLIVAVASEQTTSPVVYPVFTRALVGATATARPLRNISSGASEPVIIRAVEPQPGSGAASARVDAARSTVLVTSTSAGTFYFTFEASTGDRAVTGVLRADFVEPTQESRAVVPMTDIAYLPAGGSVVIDPLVNDTDPDGQGLAVREIDVSAGSPISAAAVDLHLVQISAPRPPPGTVLIGYTVFDGGKTDRVGQIRVVPVAAPKKVPPPLANPIAATVRAGDALTVDVSRYASSQDGSPVTAELDDAQIAELPGRAFSTGDTIRYLAPADEPPGRLTFSYTVTAATNSPLDAAQALSSVSPVSTDSTVSTVTVTVTDPDPARNSAPEQPPDVTARVFAGGSISVAVPLTGIDPDGDWVVLASLDQPDAPLGQVSIAGPDTLSYTAFGVPGVDRIRYVATDTAGATVSGVVTVLVVDPGESARPPMAPNLSVSVRPGASVRIDPLAAVVDPGGLPVTLADPAFTATPGLAVARDEQGLIVTAPDVATVASLRYNVANAKGLTASGSVTVTVSQDAVLRPPMAKDVFVRATDLAAAGRSGDGGRRRVRLDRQPQRPQRRPDRDGRPAVGSAGDDGRAADRPCRGRTVPADRRLPGQGPLRGERHCADRGAAAGRDHRSAADRRRRSDPGGRRAIGGRADRRPRAGGRQRRPGDRQVPGAAGHPGQRGARLRVHPDLDGAQFGRGLRGAVRADRRRGRRRRRAGPAGRDRPAGDPGAGTGFDGAAGGGGWLRLGRPGVADPHVRPGASGLADLHHRTGPRRATGVGARQRADRDRACRGAARHVRDGADPGG